MDSRLFLTTPDFWCSLVTQPKADLSFATKKPKTSLAKNAKKILLILLINKHCLLFMESRIQKHYIDFVMIHTLLRLKYSKLLLGSLIVLGAVFLALFFMLFYWFNTRVI